MIKAAVFDMFETLVSLFSCENYPGRKVMEDMGLSREEFRPIWDGTEEDRTCGRMTFEEVIERIMSVNGCYSDELFQKIVRKRKQALKNAYMNLNPEIIPMLRILKANGIRIGLITNCFFEEREAMKDSEMFGFFDVPCLSCELGIQKPDREIFDICLERLGLEPDECLYIGDGGSSELETAAKVGMHPMQAVWYLKEGTNQPKQRMSEFENLESPMDVVKRIFTENMRSKPIMRAGGAAKRKKLSEMTLEELW